MITDLFPYYIEQFGRIVNFVFNITINESPKITLGEFVLTCSFIGIVVYFIFGSDFFPNMSSFGRRFSFNSSSNYKPRHSPGNGGKNFSTRESRHFYK